MRRELMLASPYYNSLIRASNRCARNYLIAYPHFAKMQSFTLRFRENKIVLKKRKCRVRFYGVLLGSKVLLHSNWFTGLFAIRGD